MRAGRGQINNPTGDERASIIDSDGDDTAIAEIGNAHPCTERHRSAHCCGQRLIIEPLAGSRRRAGTRVIERSESGYGKGIGWCRDKRQRACPGKNGRYRCCLHGRRRLAFVRQNIVRQCVRIVVHARQSLKAILSFSDLFGRLSPRRLVLEIS